MLALNNAEFMIIIVGFIIKIKVMYSVHRNISYNNNYVGLTPQKTLSTQFTNPTFSPEYKYSKTPDNDLYKSNGLLEVQSVVSFGEQQIKKQQIMELMKKMRLIRFLNEEAKSLSNVIKLKKKNISTLQQKKEDKIKDIERMKNKTAIKYEYLRQKSKEIRLRNKQRQISMDYKIKLMKEKIRRVKSLTHDQSIITHTDKKTNRSELRNKHHHRRLYSQSANHYSVKQGHNKVFIPIYIPYPVFAPSHPPNQIIQRNMRARNSECSYGKEIYYVQESSLRTSEQNKHIYIKTDQKQQSKIKEFSSKLKESLDNRQNKRYSRRQFRKSQNLQSLRNSCKTNSSKGQLKPKISYKGPFETDQEVHQDEQGKSFINGKSGYSKMGYKITSSNTCEEQTQEINNRLKKISNEIQKMRIVQELQNSTINLEIPSDKKQNSSWEKETIEKLKKIEVKNNEFQFKSKQKMSDKQLSAIQIAQSDYINSSMNASDINIVITQSPSKNNTNMGLKKLMPPLMDKNFLNIEETVMASGKQLTNAKQKNQSVQIKKNKSNNEKIQEIIIPTKSKEITNSEIQMYDVSVQHSDQDIIGSINLMPESKISRNSQPKQTSENNNVENKEQGDQILSCINLAPESRISRLSRQKQALKVSRSQLKQANVLQNDQKTSISQIRQSEVLNTIQNPSTSSHESQLQLIQYQLQLRSTTPSRIAQIGKKLKKQSKKIEYMSASIEQASEEEQNNLVSQIQFKNSRRSRQLMK